MTRRVFGNFACHLDARGQHASRLIRSAADGPKSSISPNNERSTEKHVQGATFVAEKATLQVDNRNQVKGFVAIAQNATVLHACTHRREAARSLCVHIRRLPPWVRQQQRWRC